MRFPTHHAFRPDFCEAADPESKGAVEALVRYAKSDLVVPTDDFGGDLAVANAAAVAWCGEVNAQVHSEIAAVPDERLYAVLRELQALIIRLVGACPTCKTRFPTTKPRPVIRS